VSELIPCPVCATTAEPAGTAGAVVVCGACGASLVVEAGGIRRAVGADWRAFSADDLKALQHARGRIARPERRGR
jgi:hypothetical protein